MKTLLLRSFFAVALLPAAVATSFAQGLLTPPGPPGPTMKTLQQVEPRTPISSLPFTITESGSYYVTTNLDGGAGLGLMIGNSQVSVDLMGFELAGGTGSGILVSGARSNLWIRNGTLRGWSGWGMNVFLASGCTVENVRFSANGSTTTVGGLRLGSSSVVRNCSADRNTGPGILVSGDRNRIEGNHLTSNDRGVLASGVNNVIIHNSALQNTLDYDVYPGNDLGPVGRADSLSSPWGNIGATQFTLNVATVGTGTGTVTSSPAGINCGGDCTEIYNDGTVVMLTAAPDVGSTFAGWSGGGCSGTGTCTTTVNAATTVTANFTLNTYTVTVAKNGTGSGTVTSSPAGIDCGADCSEPYNSGTVVTLTAAPDVGSTFAGWSGGGCSGTGACVSTINSATTVTATFTLNTYLLTVSKTGTGTGTVTSSPAGINCGADCTELYNSGTTVTLTASPTAGSTFTGWSGGCSGTGGCTVTMDAAKTVTANFSSP
jgi:parallel beta-helix repeat protein